MMEFIWVVTNTTENFRRLTLNDRFHQSVCPFKVYRTFSQLQSFNSEFIALLLVLTDSMWFVKIPFPCCVKHVPSSSQHSVRACVGFPWAVGARAWFYYHSASFSKVSARGPAPRCDGCGRIEVSLHVEMPGRPPEILKHVISWPEDDAQDRDWSRFVQATICRCLVDGSRLREPSFPS